MNLDPVHIGAMTKLTEGFALAERIIGAARGGPERGQLSDMLEAAADDADIAVAVLARLVDEISGRDPDEAAASAAAAGIPVALESTPRRSAGGLVLP